jgi:hypothetical protein
LSRRDLWEPEDATPSGYPTKKLQVDVARVQRWCANQIPEHIRTEIRVECDVAARHLTICECRPPRREDLGQDWTRFLTARLHYTRTAGLWNLYWRDHRVHKRERQPK